MRKVITIAGVFTIVSLAFYSCSLLRALDEVQKNGFSCYNYSGSPVNTMDKQQVKSMLNNYYHEQYAAINSGNIVFNGGVPNTQVPSIDSRAVFFSIDTLQRLLYYMTKASEKFPETDRINMGVNIYFASYPKTMQVQKQGYDYTNRHTLIFVPSIFDATTNIAMDFDLASSLNGTSVLNPTYITEALLANPGYKSINAVSATANTSMNTQNHGTSIPPPPKTTGTTSGNAILDATTY